MHPIVDESGAVRFLHPTGIDITDRVEAEKALRALEAEERQIAIGLQRALLPARLAERPGYRSGGVVRGRQRHARGRRRLVRRLRAARRADRADGRGRRRPRARCGRGDGAGANGARCPRGPRGRPGRAARAPGRLPRPQQDDGLRDRLLRRSSTRPPAPWSTHPPVIRPCSSSLPAGDTIWLDRAQSGPLCGGEPRDRPQEATVLEPGSLLVLYSDGLVERRKERFEDSLERLAAAGRDGRRASPSRRCAARSWPSSGSTPRATTTSR